METKVLVINNENIDENKIKEAATILKKSGLVAFPTETVYGLGANGLDEEATKKIFMAKGRPQDNPLILHVSSIEELIPLVDHIPDMAKSCMEEFWPGPLTILFKKSKMVSNIVTAGLDTVAIRMPEHPIALSLIKTAGVPVAAPSANTSGRPSPTLAKHVIEDMDGRIDMIIDGGDSGIGLESTVLDLSGEVPMILRPGGITKEQLQKIIPNVIVDFAIIREDENLVPKSPGQKYRHYAPKSEMIVYGGDLNKVVNTIVENTKNQIIENKKVGIMCTDETKGFYKDGLVFSMGTRNDENTIAHNLFNILRVFDEENVDIIFAEEIQNSNLGMAIMNRIMKAAGGKIIRV